MESMPLDPAVDFEMFAKIALEALQTGNGALIAALALLGLVAAVRALFADSIPFLKTDLGASLLTFVLGFAGACVTALAGGSALSGTLLLTALKVTLSAMGGYSALKKFALPLLALFGLKPKASADPVKEASAAGAAAVLEKPAEGAAAIVGEPESVS